MRRETIRCLKETAAKCRLNVVRMLRASGHGHIGGTYSSIDMVTALYFYKMNVNPEKPDWEDRDRFLLSAGHKSMVQYAVLAEKGYFPKEILDTYGHLHSKLAGHPNMHKLPGVEASTGALGHGLSIATGMAMGLQLDKKPSKVYTILGDGELAEGSNWEAAAAAAPLAMAQTRTVLPVPLGRTTAPRTCWSAWRPSTPRRTCSSTVSSNLAEAVLQASSRASFISYSLEKSTCLAAST